LVRHIFQACPVWIHTQSNITNIIFTWVHCTNRTKSPKSLNYDLCWIIYHTYYLYLYLYLYRSFSKTLDICQWSLINLIN
jgi:hypothetical protein